MEGLRETKENERVHRGPEPQGEGAEPKPQGLFREHLHTWPNFDNVALCWFRF